MRADQIIGAAHHDTYSFAADQQHERQKPFFLQPQSHIGHGETDRARQYGRDEECQRQVDEAGNRLARHNLGAQLQRLSHGGATRMNVFDAGQQGQQPRICDTSHVSADRDEERLPEVWHAGDTVFQIETDSHQGIDAKKRQKGDGGGANVDVDHRCNSPARLNSSVKPCGRKSRTTMMMMNGIAGL